MKNVRIISRQAEPFDSRAQAGAMLAEFLGDLPTPAVVVGIPRGGVVVAAQIVRRIGAAMDIILTRKLGAPFNPELAVGAVAESGVITTDPTIASYVGASEEYTRLQALAQLTEIQRRAVLFRRECPRLSLAGRPVIVTDDGVATGATMQSSLRAIAMEKPSHLVCALPVAPPETLERLASFADDVLCLLAPDGFEAVGQFYRDFSQTTDDEVLAILKECRRNSPTPAHA